MRRQNVSKRKPISISGTRPPSVHANLHANARVIADRFRLDQPIARSVNGEVWQAFDLKASATVAVKLIQSRFMAGENFGVRLRREFDVLRSLHHPAVVKVLECGEASERELFLAMEFAKGTTLETLIKRDGPMKPNKLALVVAQVAGALDNAHAIGVIHRDVNPANILVHTEADGKTTVKLLDFGLAKLLEPDEQQQLNVTGAAMIVGRAEFMAPEQAGGDPVSAATDIYALGLTAYFALTGKAPFSAGSEIETLLAHLKQPVPAFSQVNPKVSTPTVLEETVRKALAKKETDRYKSAGEFAAEFCQAAGVPAPTNRVEVRSIELKAGARRHTRDNGKTVRVAASVAAALFVAAILYFQFQS